jgi:hypothetical protein
VKSIGANSVVYLSDTPPTDRPLKGRAVATAFITSTKAKLARVRMRIGRALVTSLSQPHYLPSDWKRSRTRADKTPCGQRDPKAPEIASMWKALRP